MGGVRLDVGVYQTTEGVLTCGSMFRYEAQLEVAMSRSSKQARCAARSAVYCPPCELVMVDH